MGKVGKVKWEIVCDDVLEWCESYTGESFHAILCDPPYALNFMNKAWDDNIAFQPSTWAALAEHLLPGGFIMAFGGARTFHRLACAMEDAGLVLNSALFLWAQGSGFPKSANIHIQLEKRLCYKKGDDWYYRDDDEPMRTEPPFRHPDADKFHGHRYGTQCLKPAVEPIIVAQKPWEGKRLDCIVETGAGAFWVDGGRIEGAKGDGVWGTNQINCQGTFNASPDNKDYHTQQHSQGRWPSNFILCHVPPDENGEGGCRRVGVKRVKGSSSMGQCEGKDYGLKDSPIYQNDIGRFAGRDHVDPDGLETVDAWECAPECPARKLGEQSGESKSVRSMRGDLVDNRGNNYGRAQGKRIADSNYMRGHNDKGTAARFFFQADWEYECAEGCPVARLDEQAGKRKSGGHPHRPNKTKDSDEYQNTCYGRSKAHLSRAIADSGGASRFFYQSDWSHEVTERMVGADPVHYCPKAAKRERNQNLDDFYWRKDKTAPIGFVRIDKDEWEALGEEEERIHEETGKRVSLRARGNIHPTCKPVSLNKWLATLLLPPSEYAPRRILIPFFGSGSEGIGAGLAGWEEIVGIDFEQDYCDIAESRLRYWLNRSTQLGLL